MDLLDSELSEQLITVLFTDKALLRFCTGVIDRAEISFDLQQSSHFHQNYRPLLAERCSGIDLLWTFDDGGATDAKLDVITGSHLNRTAVPKEIEISTEPLFAPSRSIACLSSGLWHRELFQPKPRNQYYLVLQFVRPFFKPHFDHVRALGENAVRQASPWLQQILGWNSRVPSSLQEFYVDPKDRLYRSDQW